VSVGDLKNLVLEEARQKANAVQADFAARASREEQRINQVLRQEEERIIGEAKAEAARRYNEKHQTANLAARAEVLEAKQKALDDLRGDFLAELRQLSGLELKKFLGALISLAPETPGVIVAGEYHREAVEKEVLKRGHKLAKEVLPKEGGFIYQNSQMEINFTTSYLANQLWVRYRTELARVLFV
jgi:vacuolar-type H+-ATPase subunit E/Vma4